MGCDHRRIIYDQKRHREEKAGKGAFILEEAEAYLNISNENLSVDQGWAFWAKRDQRAWCSKGATSS